jgi:hypothetical protein
MTRTASSFGAWNSPVTNAPSSSILAGLFELTISYVEGDNQRDHYRRYVQARRRILQPCFRAR